MEKELVGIVTERHARLKSIVEGPRKKVREQRGGLLASPKEGGESQQFARGINEQNGRPRLWGRETGEKSGRSVEIKADVKEGESPSWGNRGEGGEFSFEECFSGSELVVC